MILLTLKSSIKLKGYVLPFDSQSLNHGMARNEHEAQVHRVFEPAADRTNATCHYIRSLVGRLNILTLLVASVTLVMITAHSQVALGQVTSIVRLNQGPEWKPRDWQMFYTTDQGSWIMPYAWIKALREPDGRLFLRNSMTRYGFLPNSKSDYNPEGLPVGFLVANPKSSNRQFSVSCAACHTRQITVGGTQYRIDGGPAFTNMYGFISDMLDSVSNLLENPDAFRVFQKSVRTPAVELKKQLQDWYDLNDLVNGQITQWGIGRLDALNLIANRTTGGDIGNSPNYLIPQNVAISDVPVRYPFLWNSDRQDRTQWTGLNVNGNQSYAMFRNAGEVSGAWGVIHPVGGDFQVANSTNYDGLALIGNLTPKIGPPKWPWRIDRRKAALGKQIYEMNCTSCHGIKPGMPRPPVYNTWFTPVLNVKTDTRYYETLSRKSFSSGLLTGMEVPFTNSTVIVQPNNFPSLALIGVLNLSAIMQRFPGIDLSLSNPPTEYGAFESRVLQGIWAAAPYLHNGSVPTLAELLKPAAQRVKNFQVGPIYDIVNIGLAKTQPGGASVLRETTDASDLNSGNSNAGHEYGTQLSGSDKQALLEYLKSL